MTMEEIAVVSDEIKTEINRLESRLKKVYEVSRKLSNPRENVNSTILLWHELSNKRILPTIQSEHQHEKGYISGKRALQPSNENL